MKKHCFHEIVGKQWELLKNNVQTINTSDFHISQLVNNSQLLVFGLCTRGYNGKSLYRAQTLYRSQILVITRNAHSARRLFG